MKSHLEVIVVNAAELLSAPAYGAGALLHCEWSATYGGTYADIGSTDPLVAGTTLYEFWPDVAGLFFRTRVSNAGNTVFSDYSMPFTPSSAAIQALRGTAGLLDSLLGRQAGDLAPWTDAEAEAAIVAALHKSWSSRPRIGLPTSGDAASSSTSMEVTVPAAFGTDFIISRIDVLDSSGMYIDRVSNWRHVGTKVVVKPLLVSGLTLRFTGFKALAADASDLPTRLGEAICHLAASLAFGTLASKLGNFQRQQAIDSARVVTYQEAIGQSSYWLRMWQDDVADDPSRVVVSARAGYR